MTLILSNKKHITCTMMTLIPSNKKHITYTMMNLQVVNMMCLLLEGIKVINNGSGHIFTKKCEITVNLM